MAHAIENENDYKNLTNRRLKHVAIISLLSIITIFGYSRDRRQAIFRDNTIIDNSNYTTKTPASGMIHTSSILSNGSYVSNHPDALQSYDPIDDYSVLPTIQGVKNKTITGVDQESKPSVGHGLGDPDDNIDDSLESPFDTGMNNETRTYAELKQQLITVRKIYNATITEKYGRYTDAIFGRSALFKVIKSPSSVSYERLKRRIQIKIIQAQLSDSVIFTWVVGGNSIAAAHGNLLSQSYAAVLESVIDPFFAALGIKFYGKNYGMGAMRSAPEAAMCLTAIYGMDLDVLSWDFSMTDGWKNNWYYELWTQRAGVHPTKPSLFSIGKSNLKVNLDIESAGMATFMLDKIDTSVIPNSDADDIDLMDLASGLQYIMCSNHIESGDLCKENKWNTIGVCPVDSVTHQAKWHPGWKYHQLVGYLLAGYMVEIMFDALDGLDASNVSNEKIGKSFENNDSIVDANRESKTEVMLPSMSSTYLEYLLSLEAKDKELFLLSEVPQNFKLVNQIGTNAAQHFHRANAVCHTSLIPSYARYKGLVTENEQNIAYMYAGKTTYINEGVGLGSLPHPRSESNATPPILSFDERPRRFCADTSYDFRDSFLVRQEDNWMSVTVPNNSEKEALSSGKELRPMLGLVMICSNWFERGMWPDDYTQMTEIVNITLPTSIVVNGVNVVELLDFDDRCHVLKHSGGYYFPGLLGDDKLDDKGLFEIKIRVIKDGGTFYFSSIVVL